MDCNGQGRALATVIKLNAQMNPKYHRLCRGGEEMIKIYSVRRGNAQSKSFDVTIKNAYELWGDLRIYIQNNQIRGLDDTTVLQLTTRKVSVKNGIMRLEEKTVYRNRMKHVMPSLAHSPDEADAASLVLQAAVLKYGFTVGQRRELEIRGQMGFLETQKLQAAIYAGEFKKITERRAESAPMISGEIYGGDIYSLGSSKVFRNGF